jgi:hypothetical protein
VNGTWENKLTPCGGIQRFSGEGKGKISGSLHPAQRIIFAGKTSVYDWFSPAIIFQNRKKFSSVPSFTPSSRCIHYILWISGFCHRISEYFSCRFTTSGPFVGCGRNNLYGHGGISQYLLFKRFLRQNFSLCMPMEIMRGTSSLPQRGRHPWRYVLHIQGKNYRNSCTNVLHGANPDEAASARGPILWYFTFADFLQSPRKDLSLEKNPGSD